LYSSSSNKGAVRNAEPIKLTAPGRGGDHKDDALSREWINLLVRPRVMLRQRDKDVIKPVGRNDHSADRRDDDEKEEKKKARFHSSLGAAAGSSRSKEVTATGNALNPSVIFSTITNASEGMTCLHISKGVTRAAAGFKDSCLRVWPLNEKDDAIAKFGSLVDGKWTMSTVLPALPTKGSAKSSTPSANTTNGDGRTKKSSMRGILELYGHSKAIYGVCQSSDDDCRLVLSCSADETIRLWDTSIAQCVAKYSCVGPSWGVSFSPLGYYFASANQVSTSLTDCQYPSSS
jgi:WD40 repeat protein